MEESRDEAERLLEKVMVINGESRQVGGLSRPFFDSSLPFFGVRLIGPPFFLRAD